MKYLCLASSCWLLEASLKKSRWCHTITTDTSKNVGRAEVIHIKLNRFKTWAQLYSNHISILKLLLTPFFTLHMELAFIKCIKIYVLGKHTLYHFVSIRYQCWCKIQDVIFKYHLKIPVISNNSRSFIQHITCVVIYIRGVCAVSASPYTAISIRGLLTSDLFSSNTRVNHN